ncbi:hypothetical protein PUN28_002101 [Cardiocondyla obscurior]|uniref:Uncharacterized protein n=1 Tax=Cardiocondyla obscurior TaxID=286306 RepID=A0AAW2GSR6_9HYME
MDFVSGLSPTNFRDYPDLLFRHNSSEGSLHQPSPQSPSESHSEHIAQLSSSTTLYFVYFIRITAFQFVHQVHVCKSLCVLKPGQALLRTQIASSETRIANRKL